MATAKITILPLILLLLLCSSAIAKKVYIVQLKAASKPTPFNTLQDWHTTNLRAVNPSHSGRILYSYSAALQGYAVSLEPHEAEALSKHGSVLGVHENKPYKLLTTRTPQFMNMVDEFGLWGPKRNNNPTEGEELPHHDVIIGLLDSGIWPESKSFDDAGFPEIPARWKGSCEAGPDFDPSLCNKKLIGARYFAQAYKEELGPNATQIMTPRDHSGHGTHTASTAAGSPVRNANFIGVAKGTARGMAPHARIAMYKVCWRGAACYNADILAAMDKAILDGVDILSLSIGTVSVFINLDMVAVGAFFAMEKGILVIAAAGNDGPKTATLSNGAPWILTVGASSIDRDFPAFVTLGNGQKITGSAMYFGDDVSNDLVYNKGTNGSNLCLPGTLDRAAVHGKIVLCDKGGDDSGLFKDEVVRDAGGLGLILANTPKIGGEELIPETYVIPGLMVTRKDGEAIRRYVLSTPNPTVRLGFSRGRVNQKPAPVVANFSARGPSPLSLEIMKPDVIAPGVDILAAYPHDKNATGTEFDNRKIQFKIISGTSMACPHVSGVAALLKAAHPNWSPSMIRSALMTTAYTLDNTGNPITQIRDDTITQAGPWDMGSGHIDPWAALSPGLVYDTTRDDYVAFLCSRYYTLPEVHSIIRDTKENCSRKFSDPVELNYPSFSVIFSDEKKTIKYSREVINVGQPKSAYRFSIEAPPSVRVRVWPKRLVFDKEGQKKKYEVVFVATGDELKIHSTYGSLVWKNAKHSVRSPITFLWPKQDTPNKSSPAIYIDRSS